MKHAVRARVCGLLIFLLTAHAEAGGGVCAPPIEYALMDDDRTGGIGGTGHTGEGGIGGTGHAGPPDGGVGGTGHEADGVTGIVGTITGFASICVNGLEVHYDHTVPVSSNQAPAKPEALAVGQIVSVDAVPSGRGLEARRIAVLHALVGPVTRAANADGTIEVMKAVVSPANGRALEQARQLKVGDWVEVSGHPGTEGVLASRIAATLDRSEASASGRATPEQRKVGNVEVDHTPAGQLTVRGKWDGQRIVVRDSGPADGTHWPGRPNTVVLETRVRSRDDDGIRTGRDDVDQLLSGRRRAAGDDPLPSGTLIRVTARIDDSGRLHPIRIERGLREDRHDRGGASKDGRKREAASDSLDDSRNGRDRTDDRRKKELDREARDLRELNERQARDERRAREDRLERADRKTERSERSGRDH